MNGFFRVVVLASAMVFCRSAHSRDLYGVILPETIVVGGKTLRLNGAGLREKWFVIKFKVYVAALYLETPSRDADQILESTKLRLTSLHFLRDVSAAQIRKVWSQVFEEVCKPDCDRLRPRLSRLNSHILDMKKSDRMSLTFFSDSVEVEIRGKKVDTIEGADLGKLLLRIWIGKKPVDEKLKQNLLSWQGSNPH